MSRKWIVCGTPFGWTQYFYWADCRKDAQCYEEALAVVTSSDRYHANLFRIIRSSANQPYWHVFIDAVSTDLTRDSWINDMYPTQIEIGGEATSDHGGYSSYTYYTDNRYIWVDGSGAHYTYQTAYQDDGIDNSGVDYKQTGRWQSYWSIYPSPGGTGGKWRTYFPS
jgi:hypothetical protein